MAGDAGMLGSFTEAGYVFFEVACARSVSADSRETQRMLSRRVYLAVSGRAVFVRFADASCACRCS